MSYYRDARDTRCAAMAVHHNVNSYALFNGLGEIITNFHEDYLARGILGPLIDGLRVGKLF